MSNLALRAYMRKIEIMIEESQTDRAIFQCFLILQKFPKNFQTYQILSKAFLQKNDFTSADKIFEIILQVEPDDFVSHIGKSMVAEKSNNLDIAIEHMKNAFELQPSNEGLQNELKRLFLMKDGVEPKKINLTRGALIKMYLKGKLFPQAIAESSIGLSENPQRIDYKIAMAKAFFESGNFIQAVETSVDIVSKLPYCWPANEILDKVISKHQDSEKAGFYQKRLVELDPYYGFMLPSTNSILDIPDIAVMVEDESDSPISDFDLFSFIENTWKHFGSSTGIENTPPDDVDWDSIINKAAESSTIESGIEYGEPEENHVNSESIDAEVQIANSRKKMFRERMQSTQSSSNKAEDIPDWYFDDDGEIIQNEIAADQAFSDTANNSETLSDSTPEKNDVNHEDNGFFDSEVQPAVHDKEEFANDEFNWSNDEESKAPISIKNIKTSLDDTQQIAIIEEDPNDLLVKSEKALEGGNVQYAISLLRKLISGKSFLPEIVAHLERAIGSYPENSELRLLLGQTYTKIEEKEKALAAFQKAQKNISL